jgi:hypothetical protein
MIDPSMDHTSWSNRPAALNRFFTSTRIEWSRPDDVQRLKWPYTVSHGPNSSGKSRHGAPLRHIQQIPSKTCRIGIGGRPVSLGWGNKSAINAHCSSDTPCRAIDQPPCKESRRHHARPAKIAKDQIQNKA